MSAYVIVEVSVDDPDEYERYKALATESVTSHRGKYIVRGGAVESLEGEPVTDRIVVLEFPNLEAARGWYTSADYQAALPLRRAAARTRRLFFVEGYG